MKSALRIGILVTVACIFGGYVITGSAEQRKRTRLSAPTASMRVARSDVRPGARSSSFQRLGPFSHNTREHKSGRFASCSACHDMPEKNWRAPRRDRLDPFPDVTQYPYHDSCSGCHQNDGFRNIGFCSSCHTADGFRARGGRGVRPFPNRQHPLQFKTIFPHDVHQDLLAVDERKKDYAAAHFVPVSFAFSNDGPAQDPPAKKVDFYNCAICHKSFDEKAEPKYQVRNPFGLKPLSEAGADFFNKSGGLPVDRTEGPYIKRGDAAFVKFDGSFFKTSPEGHDSCFSCHYQYTNLPKGKQSCAGCHELTSPFKPYFDRNLINRYSLKFDHTREGHVTQDCMACHLRITQNTDVRVRDAAGVPIVADVPIVACLSCHGSQGGTGFTAAGLDTELNARKENPAFQCIGCHTSNIARYEIPVSHRKP